jgi:hypothetical protein
VLQELTQLKLQNSMLDWYFTPEELNNVPSIIAHNAITKQQELENRKTTVAFIQEVGMAISLYVLF